MAKKKSPKKANTKKDMVDDELKNMPMPQQKGLPEIPKETQEKLSRLARTCFCPFRTFFAARFHLSFRTGEALYL